MKIAGLPEPDQVLAMGSVWRADTIREFAAARRNRHADGVAA